MVSCASLVANVLLHVLNSASIIVNLLLHLAFIFLQVSQSLLQMQVLLLLISNGTIVGVADQLQFGHDVRHVVLVN